MGRKVFLSYPHQSRREAEELFNHLRRADLEAWIDHRDMSPGGLIDQGLRRAVSDSSCCVLVLDRHTEGSPWCMLEVGAFWGRDKPIVVYRTDPALPPPAFLAGFHVAKNPSEVIEAIRAALVEPPRSMWATLDRCGVASAYRIPQQNPARQIRIAELVREEGQRQTPAFRLLASSGYNYLHPHGNVWTAGLGGLIVKGARLKVVLQSPRSPAAMARARANNLPHDQWKDRGMEGALHELLNWPNVSVHVTEQPVNCSLFFTSAAVLYDPYLWGRPAGGRTENNFWWFELRQDPDAPEDETWRCHKILEKHFEFLLAQSEPLAAFLARERAS
jgi:hypothetical protein